MSAMLPVLLTRIKTADGITLDGIAILPKRRGTLAMVWLHGLTSKFYGSQMLIKEFSALCRRTDIGYFKFNTRGHDIAVLGPEGKILGSGFERFEDCIFDIRAIIKFCKKLGYKKIVLVGHSTGANKALFYLYKTRDRAVGGLALLGPMNDIIAQTKLLGKKKFERSLSAARRNPRSLFPVEYGIYDAERYSSLYSGGTNEDVFPYNNPHASWKELQNIKVPVLVAIGSRDQHLDRPAKKLVEIFRAHADSAQSFSGVTIRGADHGFRKKEKELAHALIEWIKKFIA